MQFTDTHTHLYSKEFDADQDEMMHRAIAAGVTQLVLPAIDSSHAEAQFALEKKYPENIHLMMGLHPCSVQKNNYKEELHFVEQQLHSRPFVAVGEIGIDLYWDQSTLPIQQEVFQTQIQWAKKLNLPINIHCREAFNEVFEILEREKGPQLHGIFHCFTGNASQAEQAIAYGMRLGIGGVVTFKNGKIDTFLADIPLEHIVLETDAPYLAPSPYRGKRNESSYLVKIAQKLAEIYALPLEEVARITTENAKKTYKL